MDSLAENIQNLKKVQKITKFQSTAQKNWVSIFSSKNCIIIILTGNLLLNVSINWLTGCNISSNKKPPIFASQTFHCLNPRQIVLEDYRIGQIWPISRAQDAIIRKLEFSKKMRKWLIKLINFWLLESLEKRRQNWRIKADTTVGR